MTLTPDEARILALALYLAVASTALALACIAAAWPKGGQDGR
jgi:hypothetical protein